MKRFIPRIILDLIILLLLCILLRSDQPPMLSVWDEIALPYTFSITGWEFSNFFNKWEYRLEQIYYPSRLSDEDRVNLVKEYLSLAQEASSLEDNVNRKKAEGVSSGEEIKLLEEQLVQLKGERDRIEHQVEEIVG